MPEYTRATLVWSGVHVTQLLDFCVVFCRTLFFLLFFFLPLCFLPFVDLRLQITPLISSNLSNTSTCITWHKFKFKYYWSLFFRTSIINYKQWKYVVAILSSKSLYWVIYILISKQCYLQIEHNFQNEQVNQTSCIGDVFI